MMSLLNKIHHPKAIGLFMRYYETVKAAEATMGTDDADAFFKQVYMHERNTPKLDYVLDPQALSVLMLLAISTCKPNCLNILILRFNFFHISVLSYINDSVNLWRTREAKTHLKSCFEALRNLPAGDDKTETSSKTFLCFLKDYVSQHFESFSTKEKELATLANLIQAHYLAIQNTCNTFRGYMTDEDYKELQAHIDNMILIPCNTNYHLTCVEILTQLVMQDKPEQLSDFLNNTWKDMPNEAKERLLEAARVQANYEKNPQAALVELPGTPLLSAQPAEERHHSTLLPPPSDTNYHHNTMFSLNDDPNDNSSSGSSTCNSQSF